MTIGSGFPEFFLSSYLLSHTLVVLPKAFRLQVHRCSQDNKGYIKPGWKESMHGWVMH